MEYELHELERITRIVFGKFVGPWSVVRGLWSSYNHAAQLNNITTAIKLKAVIAIRVLLEILVNVFMSEILWVNKIRRNYICRPSLT